MKSKTAHTARTLVLLVFAACISLETEARGTRGPAAATAVAAVGAQPEAQPVTQAVAQPGAALIPEDRIEDVLSLVRREYVRQVSAEQMDRIGCERTLEALDRFSYYLDPAAYGQFKLDLASAYGGIGVRLAPEPEDAGFLVLGPMLVSPAHKAGITAGELIVAVDGRPLRGASLDQAIGWLMGKPGTSVAVRVLARSGAPRELTIERAVIAMPTVRGSRLDRAGAWR
jgi:carboxyl-terminal processing protease